MNIIPYKNRSFNPELPVSVYRCLNRAGVWYSVSQNGRVIGHTRDLLLRAPTFHVSQRGRARVIARRRREVHAWITGWAEEPAALRAGRKIIYNPYQTSRFIYAGSGTPVRCPGCVRVSGSGVFSVY